MVVDDCRELNASFATQEMYFPRLGDANKANCMNSLVGVNISLFHILMSLQHQNYITLNTQATYYTYISVYIYKISCYFMNNVSVLDIKIHVIFRHVHYFRWSKIIRPKWNPTETRRDLSLKVAIIEPNTTTKPGWERKFMKFPHGKTNDEKSGHWKHDSKIACVLPSESLFLRSEGFFLVEMREVIVNSLYEVQGSTLRLSNPWKYHQTWVSTNCPF